MKLVIVHIFSNLPSLEAKFAIDKHTFREVLKDLKTLHRITTDKAMRFYMLYNPMLFDSQIRGYQPHLIVRHGVYNMTFEDAEICRKEVEKNHGEFIHA